MFYFMADALAKMLSNAGAAMHISSVATNLCPGGVIHLRYANDTIIRFEENDLQFVNLKFILLNFESRSGLKLMLVRVRPLC